MHDWHCHSTHLRHSAAIRSYASWRSNHTTNIYHHTWCNYTGFKAGCGCYMHLHVIRCLWLTGIFELYRGMANDSRTYRWIHLILSDYGICNRIGFKFTDKAQIFFIFWHHHRHRHKFCLWSCHVLHCDGKQFTGQFHYLRVAIYSICNHKSCFSLWYWNSDKTKTA